MLAETTARSSFLAQMEVEIRGPSAQFDASKKKAREAREKGARGHRKRRQQYRNGAKVDRKDIPGARPAALLLDLT